MQVVMYLACLVVRMKLPDNQLLLTKTQLRVRTKCVTSWLFPSNKKILNAQPFKYILTKNNLKTLTQIQSVTRLTVSGQLLLSIAI